MKILLLPALLASVTSAEATTSHPVFRTSSSSQKFTEFFGDGYGGEGLVFAPATHEFTLIFLHGFGYVPKTQLRTLLDRGGIFSRMKVIMPLAPLAEGAARAMRGWANLPTARYFRNPNVKEDETGFRLSQRRIFDIIDGEIFRGIPGEKIILGGFSQGGALAYLTAVEYPSRLGPFFCISCWMPLMADGRYRAEHLWPLEPVHPSRYVANAAALHLHGKDDKLIIEEWGRASVEFLRKINVDAKYVSFDAGHEIVDAEIQCIAQFVEEQYSKATRDESCQHSSKQICTLQVAQNLVKFFLTARQTIGPVGNS